MIMKQFFNHALLGAIALTGAVCFSACSSDDIEESINPTFDPVTNTVKANFSLALTSKLNGNTSNTRMEDNVTQSSGNFNGIKNILLYPFDVTSGKIGSGAGHNPIGNKIALADITDNQLNATANSHFYHYIDVAIPTGTASLLFYGLSGATGNSNFETGVLTPTGFKETEGTTTKTNTSDIRFNLSQICSSAPDPTDATTVPGKIVNYLNAIAAASYTDTTDPSNPVTYKWSASAENSYLKNLYDDFVKLKAASSTNIKLVLEGLYNSLMNNTDGLSAAIISAIETNATATTAGEVPTKTLSSFALSSDIDNFPGSLNLPDGAIVIQWADPATAGDPKIASMVTEGDKQKAIAALDRYVYPPSLYYYGNSTLLVSSAKRDADYYKTTWDNDATTGVLSGYTDGVVATTTRDIAMKDQIQYGVGRMALSIKVGAATLKDKQGVDVTVADGGFPITGVLIGAQRNVKHDFTPEPGVAVSGKSYYSNEYTIYDNDVPSGSSTSASTVETPPVINNTLVLQSDASIGISIAIEFQNNTGVAFQGAEGTIPVGGKFYLVADLDPTQASGYDSGVEAVKNKVFIQDYVTNVNLTISANPNTAAEGNTPVHNKGLGAAYNTIPDLGSPALRFGFSVDLNWSAGLIFNQEI